jgi:hypothetical protein
MPSRKICISLSWLRNIRWVVNQPPWQEYDSAQQTHFASLLFTDMMDTNTGTGIDWVYHTPTLGLKRLMYHANGRQEVLLADGMHEFAR